ncbi:uncharacterized protein LOC34618977 [Cyclospora cayetanensis]|uniref:Uncharacterized protein LOC34618977 n=2 Tax=Cyclospora cayetanensis TaxID=88456 RepID=A0A6P5WFF3_9EIME|nr:uncharacterized protein LOC34618977 [Cyclospora cayetanensis]OEH76843.1 zinc finger mynd domain-containing protein [Cyclospora cayetanensis]
MNSRSPKIFLSPSVRVCSDVGGNRGGGIVASEFIKAGKLLCRQQRPLVWSSRIAPECPAALAPEEDPSERSSGGPPGEAGACSVTSCDWCLTPYDHNHKVYAGHDGRSGTAAKRCGACKAVCYCSLECQRAAWPLHKLECRIFSHIRKASAGRGPSLTQRLLLRLLLEGHSAEEFAGSHGAAAHPEKLAAEVDSLDSVELKKQCACSAPPNSSPSTALSSYLESCAASAALLEQLLPPDLSETLKGPFAGGRCLQSGPDGVPAAPEIAALLHRLSANVHSITRSDISGGSADPSAGSCLCCDSGREVAVGLYGQPVCKFNHSCQPNALVVFGGRGGPLEVSVIALRSIAAGEEICISYISPADTRESRRLKLQLAYAFHCTCVLCCSCAVSGSHTSASSKGVSATDGLPALSFSPAEAFDLQLEGVFCSSAACIERRQAAEGDVLQHLESCRQRLLGGSPLKETPSRGPLASPHGVVRGALKNVDGKGIESSEGVWRLDEAMRSSRMRLPVLCVPQPSGPAWETIRLCMNDDSDLAPSLYPENPLLGGKAPRKRISIAAASSSSSDTVSFRLLPHDLGGSGGKGGKFGSSPQIRCCVCGAAYKSEDLRGLLRHTEALRSSAHRLAWLCSNGRSEEVQKESRAALLHFATVRKYLHPGNLVLQTLTESLSRSSRGLVDLYNGLGLAVTQRLSANAATLFGQKSLQHADNLLTEGRMLLFLAQADTHAEVEQAWGLWSAGDSPEAARAAAAIGHSGNVIYSAEWEAETRSKLVCQARECFLQACSVFFSLEDCNIERAKGRRAEEGVADCDRELHALGRPV